MIPTSEGGGKLYRSRSGMILGVCKGIANYSDFPVFWIRVIVLATMIFSGFWPVILLYVIGGIILKPEPVLSINTEDDYEFYDTYATSRKTALHRINREFEGLNRRISRMEDLVTSKEYSWQKRFNDSD
jgi:phage shock protein C